MSDDTVTKETRTSDGETCDSPPGPAVVIIDDSNTDTDTDTDTEEESRVLYNVYANRIPKYFVKRSSGDICNFTGSTTDAIIHYGKYGSVAAMSFAHGGIPAGGFRTDLEHTPRTQEQFLLAASPDAYDRLTKAAGHYPLYKGRRSLYIPNVHLTLDTNSKPLKHKITYDLMVAPAQDMNSKYCVEKLKTYSYQEMVDYFMRSMLHNHLIQCVHHRVDTVILGDWGQGSFSPRDHYKRGEYVKAVKNMMSEVTEIFAPYFKTIVFTSFERSSRKGRKTSDN